MSEKCHKCDGVGKLRKWGAFGEFKIIPCPECTVTVPRAEWERMRAESEAFRAIRGVFLSKHDHKTINPYADRIRFNYAIEHLEPRLKRTLDEVRKHVAAIKALTPSNAVESQTTQ